MEHIELSTDEQSQLRELSQFLHKNPELGFEEHKAVARQKEILESWGFTFEASIGRIDTAFRATYGSDGPTFCFISEYDALPEMGHACGHNLIATASLASALMTKKKLDASNESGTIVVLGTPGEEAKGGKVIMIDNGAFDGIDAAIMAHPFHKTMNDTGCLSVGGYKVTFKGHASHAASAPHEGINALDAVNLLFNGIGAWRQQLPESSRVHGIITDGGIAPNIIPESASATFYIRASTEVIREKMVTRFGNMVKGAALMTDCDYTCEPMRLAYKSNIYNETLNKTFVEYATTAGMAPEHEYQTGRISTDFGNVSQIIPSAHFLFGVTQQDAPLHSICFTNAAGSDYAFKQTLKVANVMSSIGYKFLTDSSYRTRVKTAHSSN